MEIAVTIPIFDIILDKLLGLRPAPEAERKLVDISPMLDEHVKALGQPLEWRHSVIDLMRLLDIDSSAANRIELAKELGYEGDPNNSGPMNAWLRREIMRRVAENGGIVPEELR